MRPIKVLALFDGMSGGQLALRRAGILYSKYWASEIDKPTIRVAQYNFPETIQIGDICNVQGCDYGDVDLIIGGSPCQSFSVAGDGSGFSGKSKLFFEYLRILNEVRKINPKVKFILENVRMKEEWRDRISEMIGVKCIEINSALLSAQNRRRLYWTNIEGVVQPEDRNIYLKDILQANVSDEYTLKGGHAEWWERNKEYQLRKGYSAVSPDKAICMVARQYANWNGNFVYLTDEEEKKVRYMKSNKNELRVKDGHEYKYHEGKIQFPNDVNGKAQTLNTSQTLNRCTNFVSDSSKIRKLTPVECERLQTIPDNYTLADGLSNSQRYKMIGNGWTIDVIAHILSFLKIESL